MPVASTRLEVSIVCCQGYMGGSEETQGTHHHVIPHVPRSLDRPLFSFSFGEGLLLCCLLHYGQGLLVVTERTWEEWDYSIFAGCGSPYILLK